MKRMIYWQWADDSGEAKNDDDSGCYDNEVEWLELWLISRYLMYTPTRIVSWCFPSNGENSLMHTSKPLELTFSNHTYTASLGFVARVYFAETNIKGLAAKLWNICKSSLLLPWRQNNKTSFWRWRRNQIAVKLVKRINEWIKENVN